MIEELEARFGIADVVRFEAGSGGLVRAVVTTASAVGHVYLHGAHVTRYEPAGEHPVLFMSPKSQFVVGKAIRGGVPVIFPWFGARAGHPTAPDHGFARTRDWTVESVERIADGAVAVTLASEADGATRESWPHDFLIRQRVVFGERFEMTLEVENRSRAPMLFEEALHTYLLVGDVERVSITGLGGATFIDKTDGMKRKTLAADPFRLTGTTDRVFLDTRSPCTIVDPALGRRITVSKNGSATTVVWNPWREKARTMTDLGPEGWRSMLCVEAANAADDALRLDGGARHAMRVVIEVEAG